MTGVVDQGRRPCRSPWPALPSRRGRDKPRTSARRDAAISRTSRRVSGSGSKRSPPRAEGRGEASPSRMTSPDMSIHVSVAAALESRGDSLLGELRILRVSERHDRDGRFPGSLGPALSPLGVDGGRDRGVDGLPLDEKAGPLLRRAEGESGPRQRMQRTVGENQKTLVAGDQRARPAAGAFRRAPRAGGEPACGIRSRRSAKAEKVALRRDGLTEGSVVGGKSVDRQPGPLRSRRLHREKKRALLADRVSEKKRPRVEGRARAIEAERLRIAERRPLRRRLLDLLEGLRAPIAESRAPFQQLLSALVLFRIEVPELPERLGRIRRPRDPASSSSPGGRPEEATGRAPRSS